MKVKSSIVSSLSVGWTCNVQVGYLGVWLCLLEYVSAQDRKPHSQWYQMSAEVLGQLVLKCPLSTYLAFIIILVLNVNE